MKVKHYHHRWPKGVAKNEYINSVPYTSYAFVHCVIIILISYCPALPLHVCSVLDTFDHYHHCLPKASLTSLCLCAGCQVTMKRLQMSTIVTVGWKSTFDHCVFVYSLPSDGEISAYGALLPPLAGNQLLITVCFVQAAWWQWNIWTWSIITTPLSWSQLLTTMCLFAGHLVMVKHLHVEHYCHHWMETNFWPPCLLCRLPGDDEMPEGEALSPPLARSQIQTTVCLCAGRLVTVKHLKVKHYHHRWPEAKFRPLSVYVQVA